MPTIDELEDIVEKKKQEMDNSVPMIFDENGQPDAVGNFKTQTLTQIQKKFAAGDVDADTGMKQIVNVLTIVEATSDPKLRKDLQKDAAKSLKSYMKGITYKDEQDKITHRQSRNEAFYKAFRPILEFDLSHLIGKRKKKIVERDTTTGRKTVKYEDMAEEPKKTYSDRSYGLCLMFAMIVLFIVPYCVASIVLAVGRSINAIFDCFEQFGKTAFYLCTSIAGITIVGLFLYAVFLVIQTIFGVKIFS